MMQSYPRAAAALAEHHVAHQPYRVDVDVVPSLTDRNRLTCACRPVLAVPHVLFVGLPIGFAVSVGWWEGQGPIQLGWGTGALGALAALCAIVAWFTLVFTGTHPPGLRHLQEFYLRWRVRGFAYVALLRDEFPPFADEPYPATLAIQAPSRRDRVSVAFRLVLALPQLVAVYVIDVAWLLATIAAWIHILFTGRYPESLAHFAVGALRWNTRVEAYLLLLCDDYPPFSLH